MGGEAVLRQVLRRDRALVVGCLLLVIALSWAYLLTGAGMPMEEMGGMLMAMSPAEWTSSYAVLVFVMWTVMMAAMMLPSAAPIVLLYLTVAQRAAGTGNLARGPASFATGYLAVWTGFSFAATALQYALERTSLLSPMLEATSVALAGGVLIGAGIYQWTPLKQACLRRCRSPLEFIVTQWRPGARGAFEMGLRHGAYCVGCCWLLMLLLFVGGVMNMVWIAAIAVFVLVEKLVPAGHWVGRGAGLALAGWGVATWFGIS